MLLLLLQYCIRVFANCQRCELGWCNLLMELWRDLEYITYIWKSHEHVCEACTYPCLGLQWGHVIFLVMAIFCIPSGYSVLQGYEIVNHQLRWFGFMQMQWEAIQHICFQAIARIVSTFVIEESTRRFHHNRSWRPS
jgi:type II secretory pathway component PulF